LQQVQAQAVMARTSSCRLAVQVLPHLHGVAACCCPVVLASVYLVVAVVVTPIWWVGVAKGRMVTSAEAVCTLWVAVP